MSPASQDENTQPESVAAGETAASEPVQPEPVQSEPVQSEPVQSEPVQSEPVQSEPVQSEPVQSEPEMGAAGTAQAASEVAEGAATEAAAAEGAAAEQAEDAAHEQPVEAGQAQPARSRRAAESGEEGKPAPARRAARPSAGAAAKKARASAASTEVTVDLPAEIFDATVNVPLMHQVVVAQQAAARQGTHTTKTRGQVRGGGRKPYRQKGTGRARQGSVRAPQFTGGGIAGGPVSRSHAQKTPKKMKAAALRGALSDRARHGLVQVVSGFVDGQSPKTADAVAVLRAVTGARARTSTVLVVASRSDEITWKSLRNARDVHLIDPGQLSTYDVLASDRVVFTATAYESFVARAAGGSHMSSSPAHAEGTTAEREEQER